MRVTSLVCVAFASLCFACAPLPARDDPWTGYDKLQHFGYSAVIAAASTVIARQSGVNDCAATRAGFGITLGVGISKEWYDANIRHTGWSWRDLVMDSAGAAIGSVAAGSCR